MFFTLIAITPVSRIILQWGKIKKKEIQLTSKEILIFMVMLYNFA